jgi:uncharacterized membrane protein YfcA
MDIHFITLGGAFCIALGVCILTGIFGVGGGFLMTPALMIFLSVPGTVAVGTGLATMLATSSLAIYKRRGTKTVDVKLAVIIGAGCVMGVILGSVLLQFLEGIPHITILGRQQDPVEYVLLWLFILLLGWIVLFMLYDQRNKKHLINRDRLGLLYGLKIAPYTRIISIENYEISIPILVGLGIMIGSLTGLLGIGGGVVLLPILIYVVGQQAKKAAGTSLLLVWLSSLVGVVYKGVAGQISFPLWTAMVAGGFLGIIIGTHFGLKWSSERLRCSFIYVLLSAIVIIGGKLYMLTFE